MMLVLVMMGLRGTGDALTPLWFMILGVILDAGLNPLLILGVGPFPRLGIAGSALATLVSGSVSIVALVAYINGRDLPIRLKGAELAYLRPQAALVKTILSKGLPIGAQMLVISLAGLAMVGLVNREGVAMWSSIQWPSPWSW